MQQVAGTFDVQNRTQMVIDHHFDQSRPGKPLWLLIPGGLVALGALCLAGLVSYEGWIAQTLDLVTAEYLLIGIAVIFIAGTFTFSYGYELYNVDKAIRLTLIIVLVMVVAVLIVVVLFVAIGALFGDKSGSSRSGGRTSRSGLAFAPLVGASRDSQGKSSDESHESSDDDDESRRYYRGGGYRYGPTSYGNAVYAPPAPAESWVPAASSEPALPGPSSSMPPPSWLPSNASPAPASAPAQMPAVQEAATAVAPPVTLSPIICPSCGLSYVPIAGKPPICPSCGAGFALPPVG